MSLLINLKLNKSHFFPKKERKHSSWPQTSVLSYCKTLSETRCANTEKNVSGRPTVSVTVPKPVQSPTRPSSTPKQTYIMIHSQMIMDSFCTPKLLQEKPKESVSGTPRIKSESNLPSAWRFPTPIKRTDTALQGFMEELHAISSLKNEFWPFQQSRQTCASCRECL